jgi:hypothetical protein
MAFTELRGVGVSRAMTVISTIQISVQKREFVAAMDCLTALRRILFVSIHKVAQASSISKMAAELRMDK